MKLQNGLKLIGGLILSAVVSSSAVASSYTYTCSDPIWGINGSAGFGTTYVSAGCVANHTANAPSTLVTSQAVLQTAATQMTNMINARINRVRNPHGIMVATAENPLGAGISAGDMGDIGEWGWGVWANASYNRITNDFSSTRYKGHVTTAMVGADTKLGTDNTILGMALGWEDQGFDTTFNRGKQDATGWSLTPYLAFFLNENWALSFLGGYATLDYDLERHDPGLGSRFYGSPRADRWYGSGDLHFSYPCDHWRFGADAGVLYMKETRDAFNESGPQLVVQRKQETKLGRFNLGGTVGYNINGYVEPYVRAAFLYDFTQTDIVVAAIQARPANGDTAGVFGGGINFFFDDVFRLNVDAYTEQFRDNYDRWGVSGMLIANF